MRPVQIENEFDDSHWTHVQGGYHELIDSFEYDVLLAVDEDDWQGDSWYLLKAGIHAYGYLQFGWGSCSGCDALADCHNREEVTVLRDYLHDSVIWFPDAETALNWFNSHDWEGDYSKGSSERDGFIKQAKALLEKQT